MNIRSLLLSSLLLASSTSLWAGERAYLHLDNSAYFLGDTLRLAAYVIDTDTKRLSEKSKVLYVELVAPEGYVVESRTYPLVNGRCAGDFYLRPLLLSGLFEVRAYTRYMQNDGEDNYYSQVVPVYEQVKNGKYNSLTIRKRTVRNNQKLKNKYLKFTPSIEWTPVKDASLLPFTCGVDTLTCSYDKTSVIPYGVITLKVKGEPMMHISLSVTDKEYHIDTPNSNISQNSSKEKSKTYYEPEQGITISGKTRYGKEDMQAQVFYPRNTSKQTTIPAKDGSFQIILDSFIGDANLLLHSTLTQAPSKRNHQASFIQKN